MTGTKVGMAGVSAPTRVAVLVRSFLVQASWNYRTMLGSGFAYALLPALRSLASDEETLEDAVRRHLELFNAHPYLASVALGAVLRLEAEGSDPETVRRLKLALRGPLGSLGDALVWATVLPGTALAALALFWLGASPWVAAAFFLVVFNAVHVGLRVWGFRAGLAEGRDVARALSAADLSGWTRRLEPAVVVLLGVFSGVLVGSDNGLVSAHPGWGLLAAIAFATGLLGGHRTWRPAAVLTVVAIGIVALAGVLP